MGLFSRKKKTETEKAKARGKTKSKRQVAKARVQRGAGKGSRNLVYILDQAPLFKLAGLGLALYGINRVIGAIDEAFADEDVNEDPVKYMVMATMCVNYIVCQDPSKGNWKEFTVVDIFQDVNYWQSIDGKHYSANRPPMTRQIPVHGGTKTMSYYAGTILGHVSLSIDVDALSNASICEIMNYLLTCAKDFSDEEIKALHNASLVLTGTGPTLIQRLKSAQKDWDWGVLPFQEGFLLLQTRLIANGSITQ